MGLDTKLCTVVPRLSSASLVQAFVRVVDCLFCERFFHAARVPSSPLEMHMSYICVVLFQAFLFNPRDPVEPLRFAGGVLG